MQKLLRTVIGVPNHLLIQFTPKRNKKITIRFAHKLAGYSTRIEMPVAR